MSETTSSILYQRRIMQDFLSLNFPRQLYFICLLRLSYRPLQHCFRHTKALLPPWSQFCYRASLGIMENEKEAHEVTYRPMLYLYLFWGWVSCWLPPLWGRGSWLDWEGRYNSKGARWGATPISNLNIGSLFPRNAIPCKIYSFIHHISLSKFLLSWFCESRSVNFRQPWSDINITIMHFIII